MRIGLNATCFGERPSGAKQRFIGLYGALIRRHPEMQFTIYEPTDCSIADHFKGASNLEVVRTRLTSNGRLRRAFAGIDYWRSRVIADRLDLFEMFNLPLPSRLPCPVILTTHDVRSTKKNVPWASRMLAAAMHRRAFRRASAVVTVSQAMKAELLGIEPRATVVTIYNGIEASRFSKAVESVRELPRQYLLAVGHLEARKNYVRLIQAFELLRPVYPDLHLIIIGADGGSRSEIEDAILTLGLSEGVQVLEDVSDDELPALYQKCRAVVFPSTYEGFGIPILETMAAGRPLVSSNIPAFVELTERSGIYFNPLDVGDIARTVEAVLDCEASGQDSTGYRRTRVFDFSFDYLSEEIAEVYRMVGRIDARMLR